MESIFFKNSASYRVTSEEFIGVGVLAELPNDGSFFEVKDSEWVNEITDCDQTLKLKHFIFCFYEEIVEILAEDLSFEDLS